MEAIKKLLLGILFAVLSTHVVATPIVQHGQPAGGAFKRPPGPVTSRTGPHDSTASPQGASNFFNAYTINEAANDRNTVVGPSLKFPESGTIVLIVIGLLSTVIGLLGAFLKKT